MNNQPRYAIYLAPESGSLLAQFVAGIIGYDPHSGSAVPQNETALLPAMGWHEITSAPRRYGAHATLKAPFRLAHTTSRDELCQALKAFAAEHHSFDIGTLAVTCVSRDEGAGFVALTNSQASQPLRALEAETVVHFERFRAPLTPTEIERRQPARLTERQRQNLADYGYPFVRDDFTFHITLTNLLLAPETIADHLADRMAQDIGTTRFCVDALYLFEQLGPEAQFRVISRFPLTA